MTKAKPKPKRKRSNDGFVIRGATDLWPAMEIERARRGLRSRNETIVAILREAVAKRQEART